MSVFKKRIIAITAAILSILSLIVQAKFQPPSDFPAFKKWLEEAPLEEKREHFENLSEGFIEEHGEDANNLRLCINLDQNWMGIQHWVEQKWRKVGIRYLDDQRYIDYIYNAHKGMKPWLVMFANTPLKQSVIVQPTDNMMRNLACIAKVYGERFNVGVMDHRQSEKVFENYDMRLDYGRTTPALIIFDNGKAYPAPTGTLGAQKLDKYLKDYHDGNCQYCGQLVLPPNSEISLYLQYAKNEVANSYSYIYSYNYMLEHFNNTWVHDDFMAPYFGPKNGRKQIGFRLIFWILVPFSTCSIVILILTLKCLCQCICGGKKVDQTKKNVKAKED